MRLSSCEATYYQHVFHQNEDKDLYAHLSTFASKVAWMVSKWWWGTRSEQTLLHPALLSVHIWNRIGIGDAHAISAAIAIRFTTSSREVVVATKTIRSKAINSRCSEAITAETIATRYSKFIASLGARDVTGLGIEGVGEVGWSSSAAGPFCPCGGQSALVIINLLVWRRAK